jgi:hypothetical protein
LPMTALVCAPERASSHSSRSCRPNARVNSIPGIGIERPGGTLRRKRHATQWDERVSHLSLTH